MLALLSLHWKGIVVGLLIATLAAGLVYWGHAKYESGIVAGKVAQVSDDAAAYKVALVQRDALLANEAGQLQVVGNQLAQYTAANAVLTNQLALAHQQQTVATSAVAALPDASLFGDVRSQLGQVSLPGPPAYSAGELRSIDTSVTTAPILQRQTDLDTQSIAALTAELALQKQQLLLTQQQVQTWQNSAGTMQSNYIACYNALPVKHNLLLEILTLGIKGRPHKLALAASSPAALSLPFSSPVPASISH